MVTQPRRGFEELPHTADVSIRVWADDLPSLFAEAARGTNSLAGIKISPGAHTSRLFEHEAQDPESLLVAFLSELIFEQEQNRLGFDAFEIALEQTRLSVEMQGGPLLSIGKPIKAVTFHNLNIRRVSDRFEVEIVFDV